MACWMKRNSSCQACRCAGVQAKRHVGHQDSWRQGRQPPFGIRRLRCPGRLRPCPPASAGKTPSNPVVMTVSPGNTNWDQGNVEHRGPANIPAFETSSCLTRATHSDTPLGLVVGQGEHQAFVGRGVHDSSGGKTLRKDACPGCQTISPSAVENHPRGTVPTRAAQHGSVSRLPKCSASFFEGLQFGTKACVFQHHESVGFGEVGPILHIACGVEPRARGAKGPP